MCVSVCSLHAGEHSSHLIFKSDYKINSCLSII